MLNFGLYFALFYGVFTDLVIFFCLNQNFSPNNCTNQGKCVGHQCVCKGDWIAKDCSVHACPDSCGVSKGRGICSKEHCRCTEGYSGKACSLHIDNNVGNQWHYLASAYSGLTPRATHSAIYIKETDSLYVYGGYDLNNVLGSLQVNFK